MLPENPRIGLIGFGEIGYNWAKLLKENGISRVMAYASGPRNRPPYSVAFRERAKGVEVELANSLEELAGNSDVVVSAVTGRAAVQVARDVAPFMDSTKMFVDVNNSAPHSKAAAAEAVAVRGAKFVDVAINVSPVFWGLGGLLYAAGDGAEEFKAVMSRYGMTNIQIIPGKPGSAAMIKTLKDVISKGTQALLWEVLLAMRKADLDLWATVKDVPQVVVAGRTPEAERDVLLGHGGIHAARKAGDLLEVADALRHLGIEPYVVEGASKRLAKVGELNLKDYFKGQVPEGGYKAILKALDEIGIEIS